MRAVRYHEHGDADVLGVDECDRPAPAEDEVLVEVRAASVNPVDVMIRSGEYGGRPLPSIPGGDGAGVVAAVGEAVSEVDAGDRVFVSGLERTGNGTFAEYVTVPETKLAQLPTAVGFGEGAAIANVGATAWTALEAVAGIQAGDRVLVHGGNGGVGHAAVQIAASSGADVIATVGPDSAHETVQKLGAAETLDYESNSLVEDIFGATDGAGVETILDHRLEEYLPVDLRVAAERGQVISLMGQLPEANALPFYRKELTVRALRMDNRPVRAPVLERLTWLMERNELRPVVAETYDFEEVSQAHREVLAGGYVGKLVVTP